MPLPQFRPPFPGSPPAGDGLVAGILRFFLTLFFLGLLLLVLVFSLVFALLYLLLRALGLGPKNRPTSLFATFSTATSSIPRSPSPPPTVDAESLESFPGSLEDYLREKGKS